MKYDYISRKEFFKVMGFAGTGAMLALCAACSKQVTAPSNVDFTLDLSQPPYNVLLQAGQFKEKDGILIGRTNSNTFFAVSILCTHQSTKVVYDAKNNILTCPAHGSEFTTNGSVINGPAVAALRAYATSIDATGTQLRVRSV